jgi:2-amino-4-hydroxy-6-hydroxymethyldihydropteridine diphosphokinase
MSLFVLSFGSNIGDCRLNIKKCYRILEEKLNTCLTVSSFYITKPWGNIHQNDFINSAGFGVTVKNATEILEIILETERELGRIRTEKWGPRILDIDLLFVDNEIINNDWITIPHPFLHERNFVLEPLKEILPNYIHPVLKKDINTLFLELNRAKSD